MKFKTITLAIILLSSFALSSQADTIMFQGVATTFSPTWVVQVTPSSPYTEDGYTFTPLNNQSAITSYAYPSRTFPGDGTDWFGFNAGNTITMATATPGGTFSIGSLDVGPDSAAVSSNGFTDVTVDGYVGSTLTYTQTFTDLTTETLETLNWTGLSSFTISADYSAGMDNISTDLGPTVPEPGTMVLLGAGLIAVGWRRRR